MIPSAPLPPSFAQRTVLPNSTTVIIVKRGDIIQQTIEPNGQTHISLGKFSHNDILNQSFGTRWSGVSNMETKGKPDGPVLYPLPATPELWTKALSHRTQILYSLDISLIVFHLDLRPGSVVLETGTGSGSLSLALARTVAPHGRVLSYDFNSVRVAAAQADFARLGIAELVSCRLCDAGAETGFPGADACCDAVFLDLPRPWLALGNCLRALRRDRPARLASFSPCFEQVAKMCEALADAGFAQIRTFEVINRELESYVYGRALLDPKPPMWDEQPAKPPANPAVRPSFAPALEAETCFAPEMAAHSGYLTFCSLFPR